MSSTETVLVPDPDFIEAVTTQPPPPTTTTALEDTEQPTTVEDEPPPTTTQHPLEVVTLPLDLDEEDVEEMEQTSADTLIVPNDDEGQEGGGYNEILRILRTDNSVEEEELGGADDASRDGNL